MKYKILKEQISQMDKDKGWVDAQPGDLAKSIMLESAELLEHFQWDDTIRLRNQEDPKRDKEAIGKEMADILIYLIKMSDRMDIDLLEAASNKIKEIYKRK